MSSGVSQWNRPFLMLLVFVAVISCASPAAQQKAEAPPMKDLVELQSSGSGAGTSADRRPQGLPLTQPEYQLKVPRPRGPRFTLSARDVDIRSILLAIGKEIPQNIIISPDVSARVTLDLKDATLVEALESIVRPHRLTYEIDSKFIRVKTQGLQTRIFHLNYIISSRFGQSNLSSSSGQSTSSGSSISSGTSSASVSGSNLSSSGGKRSTSSIQTREETNLWTEIGAGLANMVCGLQQTANSAQSEGVISCGFPKEAFTGSTSSQPTPPPTTPQGEGEGASTASQAPTVTQQTASVDVDLPYFQLNKQSGVIVIRSFPDVLNQVAEFLEAVEGSVHRQVFIEAKIIEVTLNDEYKLGIDWSTVSPFTVDNPSADDYSFSNVVLTGSAGFTFGLAQNSFNVVLDALSEQGHVSVLSSPKIATLNNQRAVIKVGTEDVFFIPEVTPATTTTAAVTEFVPSTITIGIVLDVLPQINANGQIMLSINTSVTEQSGERISPDGINVIPILDVRESNNVVLAHNGQTMVIGGLMKEKKDLKDNSVPLFSSLPILGNLFSHEEETVNKSELVIMLTPQIMAGKAIDDNLRDHNRKINQMGYALPPESSMPPPIKRY